MLHRMKQKDRDLQLMKKSLLTTLAALKLSANKLKTIVTSIVVCVFLLVFQTSSAGIVKLEARRVDSGSLNYVKTGVPFAIGVLKSIDDLRLENSVGNTLNAQFENLVSWPDGSVKSVLVSTLLQPGSSKQTLHLRYNEGFLTKKMFNMVSESSEMLQIDTGKIRFEISKTNFSVLDGLWRDLDGDGEYSANEQQLGKGEMFLTDAHTGIKYLASQFFKPRVELEESGPVRVVIKAAGKLQQKNGSTLTDFLVRIYAYAESDVLDIEYTLIDPRNEGDASNVPEDLALSVSEYGIQFPHFKRGGRYWFGGDKDKVHTGSIKDDKYITQTGRMNFIDGDLHATDTFSTRYSGVASGQRAAGWFGVGDATSSVTTLVRDFWQEFPSEFSVTDSTITIGLHPTRSIKGKPDTSYPSLSAVDKRYDRPNTFYSPRYGMAKTSRIRFYFNRGEFSQQKMMAANKYFQKHVPVMKASAQWYADSGVFGNISPSNRDTSSYDNYLMKNIYEISFKEGNAPILFGWRDFGDRLYSGWIDEVDGVRVPGFYNDTHVGSNQFIKQYLRTGDDRWWHTAEIATNHYMDIDVSHSKRYGRYGIAGRKFWTPPGEPMLISHANLDHSTRELHMGHAHVSGMTDIYLLTGDKRTWDAIRLQASWWKNMVAKLFPTPRPVSPDDNKRRWAEAERDYGWPLYTMNEMVRVTGDPSLHRNGAGQIVRHLIEWWKTPAIHEINDKNLGRNDYSKGTGWWEMDEMDNGNGNGTNPWMAGSLLSALIKFYQQDQLMPSGINQAELKDMMWQCMNYVVKYGWNKEKQFFSYSEARVDENGGGEHLLYSLAYLYQLLETDKRAGLIAHPEWYDTSDQWLKIAKQQSKRFRSGRIGGEKSYGFYGYEMVFPLDFFNVMAEIEGRRKVRSAGSKSVPPEAISVRATRSY